MNLLNNLSFINIIHIVFVGPLLILIGLDKFPQQYKYTLVLLGILVIAYHFYRYFIRNNLKSELFTDSLCLTDGKLKIIKIFDSSPGYSTPILNINQGDTVRWINTGAVQHTVTSYDNEFNSGYLLPGEIFEITFTRPGCYRYFSIPYWGWMRGKINVRPTDLVTQE